MDATTFLAALQLADSALPTGRFAHSAGLEALVDGGRPSEAELAEFVESYVCEGLAPLDGVVVAHAARAATLAGLLELDELIAARKLTHGSRVASMRCGRQLARLIPDLTDDALACAFAAAVRERTTAGNLAVAEGALAGAVGLDEREAVLLSLRGAASGALSAALRLGVVSARGAQQLLASLHGPIARASARARETPVEQAHSSVPELDLLAFAHPRHEARSFTT